jgi:glutamyl-tRNA synthetase
MYDFESAVEEGLCGVTHVMRGNEFDTRIELQEYIGGLLGFPKVYFKHYGRFTVKDATTQGREIRDLIASGNFIGWDDPRLVTLCALRRRGIIKEAYYELAKKIGMSKQTTTLDFSVIAAINRSLLDKTAKRLFAITDPVLITVNDIPANIHSFKLSFNPNEDKGERVLSATHSYYIERQDYEHIAEGSIIRLMDALNIKKESGTTFTYVSELYDHFREISGKKGLLIHFVPKDGHEVHAEILLPTTEKISVITESNVRRLHTGEVIQFERYAFCRLDSLGAKPLFWYTHE